MSQRTDDHRFARRIKRACDLALAGGALIVGAPVILVVGLFVWAALGRPVLYRDERAGLDGRTFVLLKFRTMRPPAAGLSEEQRLTRVGIWLRRLSLDELPQLWNVLRGEMSLVGPRPLLARYLSRYSAEQRRRHQVLPGITGWAQVNGRNTLDWAEKLALDVWYVDHWSLALDARILVRTLGRVLRASDVTPKTAAIMEEFKG